MTTGPLVLDPLLGRAGADEVVRIWHDFGSYGQYSNEGFDTQLAPALPQRYDARENFVRTGGRFKRDAEDPGLLGARTNYFRETYAYGDETFADGVDVLGEGERGGALAYYVDGEAHTYSPRHDTAVVLDTDTVFHGVDRVLGDESALSVLRSGQRLHHDGGGEWSLRARDGETVLARFATDDLRCSVSWKGYCFADDAERDAWMNHTDDLTLDHIIATLLDDLDDLGVERPSDDVELGKLLIERYVVFPG